MDDAVCAQFSFSMCIIFITIKKQRSKKNFHLYYVNNDKRDDDDDVDVNHMMNLISISLSKFITIFFYFFESITSSDSFIPQLPQVSDCNKSRN